jgi:hypothetical protein
VAIGHRRGASTASASPAAPPPAAPMLAVSIYRERRLGLHRSRHGTFQILRLGYRRIIATPTAPSSPAPAAAIAARRAFADDNRVGLGFAFALGAQRLVLGLLLFGDRRNTDGRPRG